MNEMAHHFGEDDYLPEWQEKMMQCLEMGNDANLTAAQNAAWRGFLDYYQHPEAPDPWIDCLEDPTNAHCFDSKYQEGKTKQWSLFAANTTDEVLIMEPCNYASNMAFYHSTVRFCDYPSWNLDPQAVLMMKRTMATLGPGSSFMHASHT